MIHNTDNINNHDELDRTITKLKYIASEIKHREGFEAKIQSDDVDVYHQKFEEMNVEQLIQEFKETLNKLYSETSSLLEKCSTSEEIERVEKKCLDALKSPEILETSTLSRKLSERENESITSIADSMEKKIMELVNEARRKLKMEQASTENKYEESIAKLKGLVDKAEKSEIPKQHFSQQVLDIVKKIPKQIPYRLKKCRTDEEIEEVFNNYYSTLETIESKLHGSYSINMNIRREIVRSFEEISKVVEMEKSDLASRMREEMLKTIKGIEEIQLSRTEKQKKLSKYEESIAKLEELINKAEKGEISKDNLSKEVQVIFKEMPTQMSELLKQSRKDEEIDEVVDNCYSILGKINSQLYGNEPMMNSEIFVVLEGIERVRKTEKSDLPRRRMHEEMLEKIEGLTSEFVKRKTDEMGNPEGNTSPVEEKLECSNEKSTEELLRELNGKLKELPDKTSEAVKFCSAIEGIAIIDKSCDVLESVYKKINQLMMSEKSHSDDINLNEEFSVLSKMREDLEKISKKEQNELNKKGEFDSIKSRIYQVFSNICNAIIKMVKRCDAIIKMVQEKSRFRSRLDKEDLEFLKKKDLSSFKPLDESQLEKVLNAHLSTGEEQQKKTGGDIKVSSTIDKQEEVFGDTKYQNLIESQRKSVDDQHGLTK